MYHWLDGNQVAVAEYAERMIADLLLEAGAELHSLERVRWRESTTREPMLGPSPICCSVLRGVNPTGGPTCDAAPSHPTAALRLTSKTPRSRSKGGT